VATTRPFFCRPLPPSTALELLPPPEIDGALKHKASPPMKVGRWLGTHHTRRLGVSPSSKPPIRSDTIGCNSFSFMFRELHSHSYSKDLTWRVPDVWPSVLRSAQFYSHWESPKTKDPGRGRPRRVNGAASVLVSSSCRREGDRGFSAGRSRMRARANAGADETVFHKPGRPWAHRFVSFGYLRLPATQRGSPLVLRIVPSERRSVSVGVGRLLELEHCH
jgi:hypothetical protein